MTESNWLYEILVEKYRKSDHSWREISEECWKEHVSTRQEVMLEAEPLLKDEFLFVCYVKMGERYFCRLVDPNFFSPALVRGQVANQLEKEILNDGSE